MDNTRELFDVWLYCQTKLKKTLRWGDYVNYEKKKPKRYNGIRRQNVADHTLSKLTAFIMLLPNMKSIFGNNVDFDLLLACIACHDYGEGLRGHKYDVLANLKTNSHDLEEYILVMKFIYESDMTNETIMRNFHESFLLQFALTSYRIFPSEAKKIMVEMRKNRVKRNTAILFQIFEKWEYFFYAREHKKKNPTIWKDVLSGEKLKGWILKLPKKYIVSVEELFRIYP